MQGMEIKAPRLEGNEQEMRRELRAFCTQVVSAIEYLQAILDELEERLGKQEG